MSWIQSGGLALFAGLVLYQLREISPLLKSLGATLTMIQTEMAALLERERVRGERYAAQAAASDDPLPTYPDEWSEQSRPEVDRPKQRMRTNPIGNPIIRAARRSRQDS